MKEKKKDKAKDIVYRYKLVVAARLGGGGGWAVDTKKPRLQISFK